MHKFSHKKCKLLATLLAMSFVLSSGLMVNAAQPDPTPAPQPVSREEYETLLSTVETLNAQLAIMQGVLDALQKNQGGNSNAAEITTLKNQINDLQSQMNSLNGQMGSLNGQVSSQGASLSNINNISSDVNYLQSQTSSLQSSINSLRSQMNTTSSYSPSSSSYSGSSAPLTINLRTRNGDSNTPKTVTVNTTTDALGYTGNAPYTSTQKKAVVAEVVDVVGTDSIKSVNDGKKAAANSNTNKTATTSLTSSNGVSLDISDTSSAANNGFNSKASGEKTKTPAGMVMVNKDGTYDDITLVSADATSNAAVTNSTENKDASADKETAKDVVKEEIDAESSINEDLNLIDFDSFGFASEEVTESEETAKGPGLIEGVEYKLQMMTKKQTNLLIEIIIMSIILIGLIIAFFIVAKKNGLLFFKDNAASDEEKNLSLEFFEELEESYV